MAAVILSFMLTQCAFKLTEYVKTRCSDRNNSAFGIGKHPCTMRFGVDHEIRKIFTSLLSWSSSAAIVGLSFDSLKSRNDSISGGSSNCIFSSEYADPFAICTGKAICRTTQKEQALMRFFSRTLLKSKT